MNKTYMRVIHSVMHVSFTKERVHLPNTYIFFYIYILFVYNHV